MITAISAISIMMVFLFGMYKAQSRSEKKSIEADKKVISLSNEEYVKQLEQSMGIGIDIVGLPGYTWKVERETKHLTLYLMDEKMVSVGAVLIPFVEEKGEWIPATRANGYYQEGMLRKTTIKHTVEDIDNLVQKKMQELSKKEIDNNVFHKGLSTIVEKYNGKAVTQDS